MGCPGSYCGGKGISVFSPSFMHSEPRKADLGLLWGSGTPSTGSRRGEIPLQVEGCVTRCQGVTAV